MKINKLILVATLGLGMAGYGYADDIYLSGSTAMRGNIYNTLSAANSVFSGTPQVTTWGSSTASSATYMDFVGAAVAPPPFIAVGPVLKPVFKT
jgi:hypothetical protein